MATRLNPDVLRRECEARDMTLSELAERAGLRRETVSRAANGRRITEQTLQHIAAALKRAPVLKRDPIAAALVAEDDGQTVSSNTRGRDVSTSSRPRRNGDRAPGRRVPAEA